MKKTSLWVGAEIQIECALVHELTHHIQYELSLGKGELQTTLNELEYLKDNYIEEYNELMN